MAQVNEPTVGRGVRVGVLAAAAIVALLVLAVAAVLAFTALSGWRAGGLGLEHPPVAITAPAPQPTEVFPAQIGPPGAWLDGAG